MLKILFPAMGNTDIDFIAQNLQQKSYTIGNVLSITRCVELREKKKFAAAIFEPKYKVFVVYVTTFCVDLDDQVYLSKKAKIAYFKAHKASTKVLNKYANFADIFSPKLGIKLLEYTGINNCAIEFIDN